MNITDIDDKIVNRVRTEDRDYYDFIKEYERYFWDDLKSINVNRPDLVLCVSDVIPLIIEFVLNLIQKRLAYEINGSVYFDTDKYYQRFPTNALCRSNDMDVSQKSSFNTDKRNIRDFALWKAKKRD